MNKDNENNGTLELAKLLKTVENQMLSEYNIDTILSLKIDSSGKLEIFDGSEREGYLVMELNLIEDLLYEDDIVNQIKSQYDTEIRDDLVEKICENVLPNRTIEELEGMIRRG